MKHMTMKQAKLDMLYAQFDFFYKYHNLSKNQSNIIMTIYVHSVMHDLALNADEICHSMMVVSDYTPKAIVTYKSSMKDIAYLKKHKWLSKIKTSIINTEQADCFISTLKSCKGVIAFFNHHKNNTKNYNQAINDDKHNNISSLLHKALVNE